MDDPLSHRTPRPLSWGDSFLWPIRMSATGAIFRFRRNLPAAHLTTYKFVVVDWLGRAISGPGYFYRLRGVGFYSRVAAAGPNQRDNPANPIHPSGEQIDKKNRNGVVVSAMARNAGRRKIQHGQNQKSEHHKGERFQRPLPLQFLLSNNLPYRFRDIHRMSRADNGNPDNQRGNGDENAQDDPRVIPNPILQGLKHSRNYTPKKTFSPKKSKIPRKSAIIPTPKPHPPPNPHATHRR